MFNPKSLLRVSIFTIGIVYLFFSSAFALNSAPSAVSITPSSGSSDPGAQVIFTTIASDPDGYQDIKYIRFLVNAFAPANANCFFAYYDQSLNKLYLLPDAGGRAGTGGFAPGSANTIENSYAKIDCSKTAVTGSGTDLTVNWAVTFKPAFSGTKNTYLYIVDNSGSSVGWAQKGTWTVYALPQAPQLNTTYKITNSTVQILAGRKTKGSSVYINRRKCVPVNNFDTWFYEYPLTSGTNNLRIISTNSSGAFSPAVQLAVNTQTDSDTLDITPPKIIGFKPIPPNGYFQLTIQDSPGVLTYNIYYKNSLSETSWSLLQGDVPVSGTGTTKWTDSSTVSQRYYKLEIGSVEKIAPTGSILINGDDPNTDSTQVGLAISASDNTGGSGISKMSFSNDNISWTTPEIYSTIKAWELTSGGGDKNVYVKFKDKAGNWSIAYSDSINFMAEQYVQRDGAFFRLGKDRFYFAGANCYYLMMYAADLGVRSAANEVLNDAKTMGLKVVRLWAFNDKPGDWNCLQSQPGVYNEHVLQGLDYVLKKADDLGLKVILTLVNNWPDYGGMDQYVAWDSTYGTSPTIATTHNDFYTDPDCIKWYKDFVVMLMNRRNTLNNRLYKEDPAIFAWELANEPRAPGDTTGNLIQNWVDEMSFYIKKNIGIKQMLSIGDEGADGLIADTGTDFVRNNNLDNIDFITVHAWPQSYGKTPDEIVSWIDALVIKSQQDLNKPLVVEEFNLARNQGTTEQRDQFFQNIYNKVYDKKAGGTIFWALYHDAYQDYDGFGVKYPNDTSTVQIISTQAARDPFLTLRVPQDYQTIQSAIDAANLGDIILVSPGVYYENISLNSAKGIVLQGVDRSTCIIDANKNGRVIIIGCNAKSAPSRMSGLTVKNGYLTSYSNSAGAGILITSGAALSKVEISNCIISDNSCSYNGDEAAGGGIYSWSTSNYIVIKNNYIQNNYARAYGGGIYVYSNTAKIFDNIIANNSAHLAGGGIVSSGNEMIKRNRIFSNSAHEYGGAGIYVTGRATIADNIIRENHKYGGGSYGLSIRSGGGILCLGQASRPSIINNVIYNNSATHGGSDYVGRGGGIAILTSASPVIKNNIFYNNYANGGGSEIFADTGTGADINYSLVDPAKVSGAGLGTGCISGDPRFIDTNNFYLGAGSPAINSGDPGGQYNDLDGSRNDMGIYGGPDSL